MLFSALSFNFFNILLLLLMMVLNLALRVFFGNLPVVLSVLGKQK